MRPNKRAAFRDRAAAGGKRRMEQVPDMDHLGRDLEADARHLLKSVRNHLQQCRDAAGGAIPRLQHPARPTRVVGDYARMTNDPYEVKPAGSIEVTKLAAHGAKLSMFAAS